MRVEPAGRIVSFFSRPSLDELAIVLVATVLFFAPSLVESDVADIEADIIVSPTATSPQSSPTGTGVAPVASVAASCDFREQIDRVRDATVRVLVELPGGEFASGTGFHVGGGLFVSAAHVVLDDSGQRALNVLIESAATGEQYPATVELIGDISFDGWGRDIVALRAVAIPEVIEWRAPNEGDVDEDVRVLGYPWSQEDDGPTLPAPLVVRGSLAFIGSVEGIEIVQSSARAEEGMSGGPLVDECGTALAVVTGARQRLTDEGALREGFGVFVSMSEFGRLP